MTITGCEYFHWIVTDRVTNDTGSEYNFFKEGTFLENLHGVICFTFC